MNSIRKDRIKYRQLQFVISLLPGSLQLIMEAEAEAESIRVSPLPPPFISTSHYPHFSFQALLLLDLHHSVYF